MLLGGCSVFLAGQPGWEMMCTVSKPSGEMNLNPWLPWKCQTNSLSPLNTEEEKRRGRFFKPSLKNVAKLVSNVLWLFLNCSWALFYIYPTYTDMNDVWIESLLLNWILTAGNWLNLVCYFLLKLQKSAILESYEKLDKVMENCV